MSKKFVRLIEKVKKGYADKYDGVIVEESKSEIIAIVQGPEKNDKITKRSFLREDWIIEPRTAAEVKHHFDVSVLNSAKDLVNSEFDVEENKLSKLQNDSRFKEVFG